MYDSTAPFFTLLSRHPRQTFELGEHLGRHLQRGDLICLEGELGAGKTTFVQGVARGWQALDDAASPTFVLVNVYRRADGALLFHLDAYRIESTAEAEELDLDTLLNEGPLVVEWAERIEPILLPERLWVRLEHRDSEERSLSISARGRRYEALLSALRNFSSGGI